MSNLHQFEEFLKVTRDIGALAGLFGTVYTLWNRWKQWGDPESARKSNPELLEKNLELYDKIPSYYPAKSELGATIQELILETAQESARLRRKRFSRNKLWTFLLCMCFVAGGFSVGDLGVLFRDIGLIIMGFLYSLFGLLMLFATFLAFDRQFDRDEERMKAKRAVFIKTSQWPDKVEIEAKRPLRARIAERFPRIAERFLRPTEHEQSHEPDPDQ